MEFEQINTGDGYSEKHLVTAEKVEQFAEVSGDKNPLHLDEEFAAKTIFKKRIAHGMYSLGLVSAALGMHFPGFGTIYMKQDSKFLKPVYIGETIEVKLEVLEKITEKKRLLIRTDVVKEDGELALTGEALVMFDPSMFGG